MYSNMIWNEPCAAVLYQPTRLWKRRFESQSSENLDFFSIPRFASWTFCKLNIAYLYIAAGSLCSPHHHHWHPRQGSLSGEADPPICVQRSRVQLSPCCKSLSPRSEAVCSSLKSQGRGCKRV